MTSTHRKPIARRPYIDAPGRSVPWQQHAPCTLYGQLAVVQAQPCRSNHVGHCLTTPQPRLRETGHACILKARCAPPVRRLLAAASLRHRRNPLHMHRSAIALREPIASSSNRNRSFLLTVAALGISHRPLPVFFTQMLGRCQHQLRMPQFPNSAC
jgi:hypothetical protein